MDSTTRALVSRDSESDLLRLAIFFKDHGIVPFELEFNNSPGAIAALAKSLSDEDFNILASRFYSMGEERMLAWILIEQLGERPQEDAIVVDRVRELVVSAVDVRQFDPLIITK